MTRFFEDQTNKNLLAGMQFHQRFNLTLMKEINTNQKLLSMLRPSSSVVNVLEALHKQEIMISKMVQSPKISNYMLKGLIDSQITINSVYRSFDYVDFSNLNRVVKAFNKTSIPKIFVPQAAELTKIVSEIRTPWIDVENSQKSLRTIAHLSSVGKVLSSEHSFAPKVVAALRGYLGDWRADFKFDERVILDSKSRISLYEKKGLDRELITLPLEAFGEAVSLIGFKPSIDKGESIQVDGNQIISPSQENIYAYKLIYSLERRLRAFIAQEMKGQCGEEWIKDRVHHEIRQKWIQKKEQANNEETDSLIEYADFTDYERIVVQKNNWNQVFKTFFRRKESFQESLRRLYPARISTMHSREINEGDLLLIYAEYTRLMKAMK